MSQIPFPGGAADQDVFFHEDKVCVYHKAINTWECRTVNTGGAEAGQPAAVTTRTVYTIPIPIRDGKVAKPTYVDLPDLRTQYDINWFFAAEHESVLFYGEIAPEPDPEGIEYKFFYSTIEKQLYVYDQITKEWEPTQAPTPSLEDVLTVGNVADKGILLTDGSDALVAIAPDEALIDIASDTSKKNPSIRLTHIDKLNFPDSQAQIELDEDGTRVDFEFNQAINDVHFRFDDQEKFVLNKDGDAQFIGKVEGEPGTQNNEFVTYGQLTTLEEEIEQLAPSLERGTWNFTLNNPPGPGEYTMIQILSEEEQATKCTEEYLQCLADANGDAFAQSECNKTQVTCTNAIDGDVALTTDNWSECEQLVFNSQDSKGVTHEWAGIDSDHYIDVFNESDDGFMVGDITTHGGGSFAFDLVSSRGKANGLASVKIFRTQGTVDFDQYVRKSGDTITGQLKLFPDSTGNPLSINANDDADSRSYLINVRGQTKEDGERTPIFSVIADGRVSMDDEVTPTSPWHVTHKKYVDEQDGKSVFRSGTNTVENFKIKTDSKTFISIGDELKLYNVADPTDSAWAANKRYVDQAVEAAIQKYNRAPAALSWKFDSVTSGDDKPNANSFKITTNNGTKYLRLDFKTANGTDLGDALWSDTRVDIDGGPVGTIWYTAGSDPVWRLKEQFRVNGWRWNYNDHFEFKLSSRHGNQTYTEGVTYYITVGGFF